MRFVARRLAARISGAFAFIALALVGIVVSAKNTPQLPKIRVSTRLVQIDVIARDKNGAVTNLTKDDFVVLDRRKPRQIAVFSVNSTESAPQPAPPAHSFPQNTFCDLPWVRRNETEERDDCFARQS
jgi:hypothetical protein